MRKIFYRSVPLLLVFCFVFLSDLSFASDLARKLGFSDTDKVLLLHADDMGMTLETNQAVRDVIEFGMVKSASIIVPAPGARDAIENNADLDLGVHVALNSEWNGHRWGPVAGAREVPSLVVPFCPQAHMFKYREPVLFFARTHDVEKEIRAQIDEALRLGLKPTHMDSHMAMVLMKPRWARAYLRQALNYKIPPMIVRWSSDLEAQLPRFLMDHLKEMSAKAVERGYLPFDYIRLGLDGSDLVTRKKSYIDVFKNLKPGVTMIFMHPSYFKPANSFPKDVVEERTNDALLMRDTQLLKLLKDLDIKLIGWKDIQRVYDWNKIQWPR